MKTVMMMTVAAAVMGAGSAAFAQDCGGRGTSTRWEQRTVVHQEQVLVGYRDEVVGTRDVMVEREITEYAERTVWRRVLVGTRCGRPVYRNEACIEKIPVCTRIVTVCERQPIIEKRPVYELRDVECTEWVKVIRKHR